MAIFVISVSSNSSEESVGTSTGRVILFGTIPTTILDTTPSVIPPTTHIDTTPIPTVSPTILPSPDYTPTSPDYTPASPDYSSASDMEFDPSEDPSSDHIPPLPATSPFLLSTDDSLDNDIPDTPPSPTHGAPFTKTTLSTQSSHVALVHIRRGFGPLPTHRLAARHSDDYSSSDHFSLDDSLRDSLLSSSLETSSDSSVDALSDSASSRSSSDHSLLAPSSELTITTRLNCYTTSIKSVTIYFPNIAYADALRDRGIDFRVVVEAIDREEIQTGMRGPVEVRVDRVTHPVVADDIPRPAQEGVVEVTYETLEDLVQMFHDHTEEIPVHRIEAIKSV
ncbi:hypothetical protein Tco_1033873 [Tanacetum coccineum]